MRECEGRSDVTDTAGDVLNLPPPHLLTHPHNPNPTPHPTRRRKMARISIQLLGDHLLAPHPSASYSLTLHSLRQGMRRVFASPTDSRKQGCLEVEVADLNYFHDEVRYSRRHLLALPPSLI